MIKNYQIQKLCAAMLALSMVSIASASPDKNLDQTGNKHLQRLDLAQQQAVICHIQANRSIQILTARYNGVSKREVTDLVLSYDKQIEGHFAEMFPNLDPETYALTQNDIYNVIDSAYDLPIANDEESQLQTLESFANENLESCLNSLGS